MSRFAVSPVKVSDIRGTYLCSDDLPNQSLYFEYGDTDHGEMDLERMEDMMERVAI
jgi:hypothetical protein